MTLKLMGYVEFERAEYGAPLEGTDRFVPRHDRDDYRPLEAPFHRRPVRKVYVETVENLDGTTRELSYPYVELEPAPRSALQPLPASRRVHPFPEAA